MNDVLLVGLGAVGAIYSLILKRSGKARLTVVARSNYDVVRTQGLTFRSQRYGEIRGWQPDRLCKSIEEATDRQYSHVFITTKAVPEITKTPDIVTPFLQSPYADKYSQPTYILMQNGLGVERDLYKAIRNLGKGEPRVIGTAHRIATNLIAPNVVEHNTLDTICLGIYRFDDMTTSTNTPEENALLEEVNEMLLAGGSDAIVVPQIQWAKFKKNFWNVAFSSIATLSGYPLMAFFRHPPTEETGPYEPYVHPITADKIATHTLPNIKALLLEMLALGRAIGIPDSEEGVPSTHVDAVLKFTMDLHTRADSFHKPSMLLDMERNLPLEVEVILGEVVHLAKQHKVDVPRIEMLYSLLLVVQNQLLQKRK
ncbi:hypothetical protein APHAL10511_007271 [Amanita phalloides]|nr:hypothetical protein APHAL10511_007271 [Amanita phalloides]